MASVLPVTDGLAASIPLVEPAGEWRGSVLRSVATAVGVLAVLRAVALTLGAAGWFAFPHEPESCSPS